MSERKYTDEEIVKALACCINADCLNCPQWSEEWYSGMCNDFLKSVLDLIKRQKAEIERLREDVLEVTAILGEIELRNAQIKAEAIKEFAVRVKEERGTEFPFMRWVHIEDIDLLVAEMTEGK